VSCWGLRVVGCRKVGVRPLVLFSPSRFQTENLGPRLLRLSPEHSRQNKTRERSEKGPVRIVHSHTVWELRKVYWRNACCTVPSDYSHGMQLDYHAGLYRITAENCAHVLHSRVVGEARCAIASWRSVSVKNSDRHGDIRCTHLAAVSWLGALRSYAGKRMLIRFCYSCRLCQCQSQHGGSRGLLW
jgi:hypothetical protein